MSIIEKGNKFYMSDYVTIDHNERDAGQASYHEHYHDFVELVYTLKGKCIHRINGTEYSVKKGDLLFINYNQSHSITGIVDTYYINIMLKPEYINRGLANQENAFALLNLSGFEDFTKILDESKAKVTFSGVDRDRIEEIISVIKRETEEKKPGYDLAVRSELNLLLIMVFRKMSLAIEEGVGGIDDKLLMYLRQHSSEKLTLDDTAKRCSYNPSYFSRAFKAYTGLTFTGYIKKIRIEKAINLLENTNMKINDIYTEVGYTDKTKFFSHFKNFTGTSPLNYRKSRPKIDDRGKYHA